jgi:hypothetical protein
VDVGEVIEAPPAELDVYEATESVSEAQTSAVEAGPSGSQSTPDCSHCSHCLYYRDSSEEDDNVSLEKDSDAETPRERVFEYCRICGKEIPQGLVFCTIPDSGHYFGGCCMRCHVNMRCTYVYEPEDATANLPPPPSMQPYVTWNRQTSTGMSAQERESLATVIQDESYTVHTGGHTPWSAKAHKADHTSALAKAHTGGHTPGGDENKRKKEHQDFCKRQKKLNASKCEVKKEEEGGEAAVAPKPDESWPKPSYLEHLIVDHGTSSSKVYDGPDITFQSFSDAVKGRATKFQKGRMYWLAPDEYQVAGPGRGIFWPKDRWCYEFFFGKKVSLTDRHGEPLWD